MKPDGTDVRQLTALTDGSFIDAPAWSPDGKQIIFVLAPSPDFIGQLWVMNTDGSNRHRLFTDGPGFGDYQPDFSPDGKQVLLTRCGPVNCAIYRVQADGSGLASVTPFNSNPDVFDVVPRYSPDGRTIAFGSFARGGILGAIYLTNDDGSTIRRLTPAPISAIVSDWSPDAQKLSMDSHCCNPQLSSLFLIGTENGELTRVTFDQNKFSDDGPSWSPQGDAIIFQRQNSQTNSAGIFILRFDGTSEKLILEKTLSALRLTDRKRFQSRMSKAAPHTVIPVEKGGFQPRWGVAQ
jgi:TolB protein